MRDFKAEIQWLEIEKVLPYKNNAKKHPASQVTKLAQQIAKFGFDQPIVVDKNLVIIKGHGRLKAAQELLMKQVPVVIAEHLSEHESMAARIADNNIPLLGDIDTSLLKFDLGTLRRVDFDLSATSFDLKSIDGLLNQGDLKTGEVIGEVRHESAPPPEPEPVKNVTEEYQDAKNDTSVDNSGETVDNSGSQEEIAEQFIVAINCKDEQEMQLIYEEMTNRGLDCNLIT